MAFVMTPSALDPGVFCCETFFGGDGVVLVALARLVVADGESEGCEACSEEVGDEVASRLTAMMFCGVSWMIGRDGVVKS